MLKSITIKNVATFDTAGVEITDLKKINFIYGANGSGKTTISKFIANPQTDHGSLVWESGEPLKALVYNKDFRENNFGKGKIDGVFTLGQATKKDLADIEELQNELDKIKVEQVENKNLHENASSKKNNHEKDFTEWAWIDIQKEYKDSFGDAFKGLGDKKPFKEKVLEEFQNNSATLETIDKLKEKAATIFGQKPTKMELLPTINFERILEIETAAIWQKKIIGKADIGIAALIKKLNLSDWVNQGKKYLQTDKTCPFCQQPTITEDFKKQLEDYFDESFTNDTQLVKSYLEEYITLTSNIVDSLTEIESSEKANENTKLDMKLFPAYRETLSSQFSANRELINNKLREPSHTIDVVSVKEQLKTIRQLIANANKAIEDHNHIVLNYGAEKEKLIKAIWKFLIEENREKIESFNKKSNELQTSIKGFEAKENDLQKDYDYKNNEITEANKNITSTKQSVSEINTMLKSHDFTTFKIVPLEDEKYQIQREDGSIAESTLSEGEVTFITFLYFLQLAKGSVNQETISEKRILVVDDPVSSLDSNVLFVVSTLLKEMIEKIKGDEGDIKQLLLLTHNVYFHKEASFIRGVKKGNISYWILRRNGKTSLIQSFGHENPIKTFYELLWQELNLWKKPSDKQYISGITIQNTMRRIIENYFKILGKYDDNTIVEKFEDPQEKVICRSLMYWMNEGSHSIPDDLFIEDSENTIDTYFEVFKNIFTKMGHTEHYNMMMGEDKN